MSQSDDTFNPFDPTGVFKEMRNAGMDAWSKMMIQFVNTEAYARANGQVLDAWLATSTPLRKAMESAMAQALAKLNLPARADFISLAERLTNIELRLDDMEAKLDEIRPPARRSAGRKNAPKAAEN
jgi:hypothetical protein